MQEYVSKLYDALVEATSECKANYLSFSGGLDSTIIAYLLKERIHGVSVIVSDYAAPDNTFIEIAKNEFNIPVEIKYVSFEKLLPIIDELIKIFQNFNFIEIRNFVGMYLTFKMAKDNGQNSIITGDAADELFAGYNFLFTKKEEEIDSTLKKIWQVMQFPSSKIATHFEMKVEHPYLNHKVKKLVNSKSDKSDYFHYIDFLKKSSFDVDFTVLVNSYDDFFHYSGFLTDMEIPIDGMKKLLAKIKDQNDLIAEKFIEKINNNSVG